MKDITCPYCGNEQFVRPDGSYGREEGTAHEVECESCEKKYQFFTTMHFSYREVRAECLNDGNHQWKLSFDFPDYKLKIFQCKGCGAERREHAQ